MKLPELHPAEPLDAPKDPNRDSTASTPKAKGVDLLTPRSIPASVKLSVLRRSLDLFRPHHIFLEPRPRPFSILGGTQHLHSQVPAELFHAHHLHDPPGAVKSDEPRPSAELGPGYIVAKMAFSQANPSGAVPGTNARTELGEELVEVVTSVQLTITLKS
jgi:hypothetical protein